MSVGLSLVRIVDSFYVGLFQQMSLLLLIFAYLYKMRNKSRNNLLVKLKF